MAESVLETNRHGCSRIITVGLYYSYHTDTPYYCILETLWPISTPPFGGGVEIIMGEGHTTFLVGDSVILVPKHWSLSE